MKEIVIKLTDHCYKRVVDYKENLPLQVLEAIRHGVVLPKGHGRLIDEKVLLMKLRSRNFGFNLPTWVKVAIDNTPAIIEADKEERK